MQMARWRRCRSHKQTSLLADIQPIIEALRALYSGKEIIVRGDKLDVVKGVFQQYTPKPLPRNDHHTSNPIFLKRQRTAKSNSSPPPPQRRTGNEISHNFSASSSPTPPLP
ncbi:hypothetical protein EDB19DRAFT_1705251 [Suillus lakei]|nr:hypothetical protein EDB19DRAFT_1705251 [Suillus lakei]